MEECGGHGMNLAINDAEELADRIGPKLASGEPILLKDLKGYEAERWQANERALRQAHDILPVQACVTAWRVLCSFGCGQIFQRFLVGCSSR